MTSMSDATETDGARSLPMPWRRRGAPASAGYRPMRAQCPHRAIVGPERRAPISRSGLANPWVLGGIPAVSMPPTRLEPRKRQAALAGISHPAPGSCSVPPWGPFSRRFRALAPSAWKPSQRTVRTADRAAIARDLCRMHDRGRDSEPARLAAERKKVGRLAYTAMSRSITVARIGRTTAKSNTGHPVAAGSASGQ